MYRCGAAPGFEVGLEWVCDPRSVDEGMRKGLVFQMRCLLYPDLWNEFGIGLRSAIALAYATTSALPPFF